MSDKKNIDRLFQEKFKDFEVAPPEFVWDNIREVLEEKKNKRVIPLWFRLGGVAAVIAISFLLGNFYINDQSVYKQAPSVTTSPGSTQNPAPLQSLPTNVNNGNEVIDRRDKIIRPVNNGVVVNDNGKEQAKQDSNKIVSGTPKSSTVKTRSGIIGKEDALVNRNPNKVNNGSSAPRAKYDPLQQDNPIVTNAAKSNTNTSQRNVGVANNTNALNKANNPVNTDSDSKSTTQKGVLTANTSVANNSTKANKENATSVKGRNDYTLQNGTVDTEANNAIAAGSENANETKNNRAAAVIDKTTPLTTNAVAETSVDTAAVAPENELEKLLKEQQKDKDSGKDKPLVVNTNKSKWNVKPQLAPVFYNSLSKGSPIDGQFASNSKSYDNDLSIGIGLNYAVTDRITIRSGVNTVNLNYATQGVEFYASLNEQTNNVAARSSSANIVVLDQGTTNRPEVFFADMLPKETFNGAMVQKTGYVEVPVEMSYALLNKKFGIDIIGGISTLFLNQNNVSVVSTQGYSTNVGKAQNLNNIHFSTNLGVGFKYRFFKSFEANFEPMFKYQVNTFSRDAGNFKPYFIGLYSGVSFSF